MPFPFTLQHDQTDCGPSCLRMIAKYYGKSIDLQFLREKCYITREGVSLLGIAEAAEEIGFRTKGLNISYQQLSEQVNLPCIIHWNQNHFVVVYKITNKKVYVSDPGHGLLKYSKKEFCKNWLSNNDKKEECGICLLLEPLQKFYESKIEGTPKLGWNFIYSYLKPYKKVFFQLILSLVFASLVQLILPFITQAVVDTGINTQSIRFIYLALIAQMVLSISRMTVDFIRTRILLHISTRINISIISDFLAKLMRLPLGFFDSKMIGDLLQRISDHERIEHFLTSQTLNVLFSFFNLIIFGIVLAIYNFRILAIFIIGSTLYGIWILLFMKKRKELDYKRFNQLSRNQSNTLELIEGMQEIKLNNCEQKKRWKWEQIQALLFQVNLKNLTVTQYQQSGSIFINETKNILITIMSATAVINGQMTLGMMLAVQYIIGQLNAPIEQMIDFFQNMQLAKISIERLVEVHGKEDEESRNKSQFSKLLNSNSISLNNVSFQYEGPHSPMVLNSVSFLIPENKITAIVGASGSGKTTLLKLLLGFYKPVSGEIKLADKYLYNYSQSWWRGKCGSVMQDGFIFSDTIAENIAISSEYIDEERLLYSAKMANIHDFISSLPLGYNTKVGKEGNGLSQGQKQRILIARAIYKNPLFVFFDEATNALDANNELIIMDNLNKFFKNKTVVVVAHRLSTVKNSDQIIVLDKGQIVETGTHNELLYTRGSYFNLVKNQLELES